MLKDSDIGAMLARFRQQFDDEEALSPTLLATNKIAAGLS